MPVGYKLRAGNPDALLSEQQTADQTLYVRTAAEGGNDLSGDGSASFPYLTIDRAVKDVSVVSRYKTTVDIGAGSFDFPIELSNYATMEFMDFIGATDVESSEEISAIVTGSTIDEFLRVRVTGSPGWTNGEHKGKIVKWTSGTLNNRYGVIYDNDTDSVWVTQNGSAWAAPGVADTFDILDTQTTINLTTKTGSALSPTSDGYIGTYGSKITLQDLKISSTISAFSGQLSVYEFIRCNLQQDIFTVSNNSFVQVECSYVKSSGSLAIAGSENSMLLARLGTVIDGGGTVGCVHRHSSHIRYRGEVVYANLSSAGIQTHGIKITRDRDDAVLRFYSCAAGFKARASTPTSSLRLNGFTFAQLPQAYGDISGNFFIEAGDGDQWYIDPNSVVTTALANDNSCSVNGVAESYFQYQFKTAIFGSGNEQENNIPANATSIDVSVGLNQLGIWETSSGNSALTTITDFTNSFIGQEILIRGTGGGPNQHRIVDGGNFELEAATTWLGDFDEHIKLYRSPAGPAWKEVTRRAA